MMTKPMSPMAVCRRLAELSDPSGLPELAKDARDILERYKGQRGKGNPFDSWLAEKGLTLTEFCKVVGVAWGSAVKWRQLGVRPYAFTRKRIKRFYPDCPLVKD